MSEKKLSEIITKRILTEAGVSDPRKLSKATKRVSPEKLAAFFVVAIGEVLVGEMAFGWGGERPYTQKELGAVGKVLSAGLELSKKL